MQVRIDKTQPNAQENSQKNKSQKQTSSLQQMRILSRFDIKEKLGSGSFGHIYKAFDQDRNEPVALKIESHSQSHNLTLNREAKILYDIEGGGGFPTIYHYSKEEGYSVLAMSLLGSNLEKLFKSCNRKFSLKTVLMLADQMIRRIEYVHSRGYLHRDIKPENFVMGPQKDPTTLFLIDFGLSKMYRDHTGKLNPYKEGRGLVGTARYASISTHLGIEQSRRDDLESIGYLLIYFLKGSLPWQNVRSQNKTEKYKLIADCKMNTPIEALCQDLPKEFSIYLNYVKNLSFTDQPDYKFLKKLFRQLLVESGNRFDFEYDWYKFADSGLADFVMSAKEGLEHRNGHEDTVKADKKLEIYEDIKLKALEFNMEFRGRNKNMEFAPPQGASKGKGQDPEPEIKQTKFSMSPTRKPRAPALFVTTSAFGKMNPKIETHTDLLNVEPKNTDLVATVTTNYAKGSTTDSPLYPRKMRVSSRNIMPEKPNFSLVCIAGVSKDENSSPQLSVNKGSLGDMSDEFEEQDEKSPCDQPINQYNKHFVIKRLGEVKAKTVNFSSFKGGAFEGVSRQNNGKALTTIGIPQNNNTGLKLTQASSLKREDR